MTTDVVLTSALRSNLLSLQGTQNLIDRTQLRLATGLEVNSALDNPQNFFTSQSLNNRASDLSRLLDGIGQSIRTIEEADNGISALTDLAEQAQSITSAARDELAASQGEARLLGTVDLSGVADITDAAFAGGIIDAGDQLTIATTDSDGNRISETITIQSGTAFELAADITNRFADNQNGEIFADINSSGNLSIQSANGQSFRVIDDFAGGNEVTLAGLDALGIGRSFQVEQSVDGGGAQSSRAATTVVAGNTITSVSLFESNGTIAEDFDQGTFTNENGEILVSGFFITDSIVFTAETEDGPNTLTIPITARTTFRSIVDDINNDPNLSDFVQASFDNTVGQLSITSISDDLDSLSVTTDILFGGNFSLEFGDPTGNLDDVSVAPGTTEGRTFSFNSSTESLDALANDFNTLRSQIDSLVADASFRGINLLNGDDLTTFFNEDNTSSLTTQGSVFTANGLGITEATFRSASEIELSATQARDGLNEVRNFGNTLANNLSIIQTRQTFTQQTINTLTAGADDLVVADQNEEGANLLALQTRQALGVTALSLAAQSQQSVLSLF